MSAEPVRRRKNRKTNTSLGIPHTFSFPLLPTHECRAVNLHIMTLKILFHMDVKWGTRRSAGHGPETGFEEITGYFLEADFGTTFGPGLQCGFLFIMIRRPPRSTLFPHLELGLR